MQNVKDYDLHRVTYLDRFRLDNSKQPTLSLSYGFDYLFFTYNSPIFTTVSFETFDIYRLSHFLTNSCKKSLYDSIF